MGNSESILRYLRGNSAGACDDCLSRETGVIPRQEVNVAARALEAQGVVVRSPRACPLCNGNKIVTRLSTSQPIPAVVPPSADAPPAARAWTWEGNIQAAVVRHLSAKGYLILRVSDTGMREQGKDIVARAPTGEQLWISVKGLPETSVQPQARHWFGGALFDVILYREESSNVRIGVGLPDGVSTYLNLARRVTWFKQASGLRWYWVSENGSVREE